MNAAAARRCTSSGAPVDGLGVAAHGGATRSCIVGTDWQKADDHPADPVAARSSCCLGYSEPDAGSDVAACATKAVRDGDEWVHRRPEDVHDAGPRGAATCSC